MTDRDMHTQPLVGSCGVEIGGVDLAAEISPAVAESIVHTLWSHHLIVFRDQDLDPARQAEVATMFGELKSYPFVEPLAGHPFVIPIIKNPDDSDNFGGVWHTDNVWTAEPAGATMLYGVEVPARGGDTLFADCTAALDALSPAMVELLSGLHAVYDAGMVARGSYAAGMQARSDNDVIAGRFAHPVVRTHPFTGQQSLYFSPPHTRRFDGMTPQESQPLMAFIAAHQTRPEFITRVSWQPGTVTIWDNRAVNHFAVNDYAGQRRHMHRVTVGGERPT